MDICLEFGQRVKELRARSGMSQEQLAYRSGLDRTYISGVERGERNISLVNIQKITSALQVTMSYMFSVERFSLTPTYLPKDFKIPFKERFKYNLDPEKKVLAFSVSGLFSGKQDVDYLTSVILGICSAYGPNELDILVDHREMKASDGEAVVYSPGIAEQATIFQQELTKYSNRVVALCNSEFMVQQLNHVAKTSGIFDKATHLYDKDKDMIGRAFSLLDIHSNALIKPAK
ncbi:helix-turn-helix domain-containing protein [Paenibacillus lignilyticus]|uniref:Helix-turn-helix transcriptional regulator n=1 Tax=Paenibacillus lignilyticus TaxID=1172615 RepID=A0ABS5CEC5_9BACL|nr:helix-turn-helix transcriptional regulator [Paenibacillus lignilyticus]MBP3964296.1 helix-turn-helix transcriptional regulator [Paenibacillus lignilyticus]